MYLLTVVAEAGTVRGMQVGGAAKESAIAISRYRQGCSVCPSGWLQETELRTLRASAEDIATKFDGAVAALAAKRLDLQMEVSNRGAARPQPAAC